MMQHSASARPIQARLLQAGAERQRALPGAALGACRYAEVAGVKRPPCLRWWLWMLPVVRMRERDILAVSGYDGVIYLRIFSLGEAMPLHGAWTHQTGVPVEHCQSAQAPFVLNWLGPWMLLLHAGLRLFLYLSVWCLAVVLPVNMSVGGGGRGDE